MPQCDITTILALQHKQDGYNKSFEPVDDGMRGGTANSGQWSLGGEFRDIQ